MMPAALMHRRLPWLVLLALAVRVVACVRAPLPARDGTAYLWMAREFAHGNAHELCAHVFHPLYPALVAVLLRALPAIDPVLAGQIVAAGCSTLTVVPLYAVARRLAGERAATWACLCFALGSWFARHPAECLSEGPFQLGAVAWAAALLGERPALAGAAAGLAFLVRPEGAAFVLVGTAVAARAQSASAAVRHALAGGAIVLLLPFAYLACGGGFVLTPKLAFNWDVGAGGAPSPVEHYLHHLLHLPGDAYEGLGYVVFPLALLGLWLRRPWRSADTALLLPFAMQCAVIPLLRSHLRFVSGTGVLLLPFAGCACEVLVRRGGWRAPILALLLVASEGKQWFEAHPDRTAERDVGRWLATQLRAGDTLASDMPLVYYFADRRPPPPRTIAGEDLLRWAADPRCAAVIWKHGRSTVDTAALARAGFAAAEMPAALRTVPGVNDLVMWRRSP
jgi:hypothetical protein